MEIIKIILLGAVQGLTEFLPVSSSGHIVLAREFFNFQGMSEHQLALSVLLHLASLLAIFIVFRRDLITLFYPKLNWKKLGLLAYLTLPVGLAGILVKSFPAFEDQLFGSLWVAFGGLSLTAGLLFWGGSREHKEVFEVENISKKQWFLAGLIGMVQMIAIVPGVSRSGSTIVMALLLGWKRHDAVRLSFLMGFISLSGAGVLELKHISEFPLSLGVAGFMSSLVFSLLGLWGIQYIVKQRKLSWFGFYLLFLVFIGGAWALFVR